MSLRVRLILSFAILTVISVVSAVAGYIAFRQSVDQYHRLVETVIPAQMTVGQLVDLSREIGGQPLSFMFTEPGAKREEVLAEFREQADEFISQVELYQASNPAQVSGDLLDAARSLVDEAEELMRLMDQWVPIPELEASKERAEAAEDTFQDLLGDAAVSLEAELARAVVSDSSDTVAAGTVFSIVASIVTSVSALYILIRVITRPIEQLEKRAKTIAGGDYSSRISIRRADEIGALALAFNDMADAVEKRQQALLDLNQSLEARVMERTEALRVAKDEAEAILNSTTDAILLVDQNYALLRANHAFLSLFGYGETDIPGISIRQLVEPDQQSTVCETAKQLSPEQAQVQIELQCRRRDGTAFEADATFGVFGGDSSAFHIICSFHDITPQKLAQQELAGALRKERELSAMKSGFVSLVSHEFRTPLAVIQSAGDLIQHYWERLSDAKRDEKMREIQSQIGVMTNLLDNFLSVNGVETLGMEFAPNPLDLIGFTRDLIDEMRQATGTDTITLARQETAMPVNLDAKLLRQILVNLLTNAMKYSTPGSPIEVEIVRAPDEVTIRIRDQGMGIPAGDQPHIFDAFHRGTNIGNIHGTGLGLAIVKHAVEAHHGEISFQSGVGQGTTMTVILPTGSTQEEP